MDSIKNYKSGLIGVLVMVAAAKFFVGYVAGPQMAEEQRVSNAELGYSISVPKTWQVGAPRDGVPFVARTDTGRVFEIGVASFEELSALTSDSSKEFFEALSSDAPGLKAGAIYTVKGERYVSLYIPATPATRSSAALSYGRLDENHPLLLTLSGEEGMSEESARTELESIISRITWSQPNP